VTFINAYEDEDRNTERVVGTQAIAHHGTLSAVCPAVLLELLIQRVSGSI
jgi:hypothetical protein